ncbi:MAG: prolyl-tRNA synthetase associated domain-containing protein [Solobacterium sp.]|nr:prolyl-tRNA synthetase associated domain-containing protein [Solobacterium sp.]
MNRADILSLLEEENIPYEMEEHRAVNNMEELNGISLRYPEDDAKNLFVRDDKKRNYYLITIRGDKKADLKKIRREENTRALSFASDSDLQAILELSPGSVTPLGLLNDRERSTVLFLDEDCMKAGRIGVHPNDNTATLWLRTEDLTALLQRHGCTVRIIRI